MSKMAMSYVILAVCITFRTANAGALDWTNPLGSLLPSSQTLDQLRQGLKLTREGLDSALKQSDQMLDQTIDKISHEQDLTRKTTDSLLKNIQSAKPCDKLKDQLEASKDLLLLSVYDCTLKGLLSVKLTNENLTTLNDNLLDKLDQNLPDMMKCLNKLDMSSKLSCLLSTTASDVINLAPSLQQLPTLLSTYFTLLPNTALCIAQSWPNVLSTSNLLDDAKLCGRSYAQSLICDKTT